MTSHIAVSAQSSSGISRLSLGLRTSASASPDITTRPSIPRSQAYFWSAEWQQWETLADYDRLIGDYYEPESVDDLIAWLNDDE